MFKIRVSSVPEAVRFGVDLAKEAGKGLFTAGALLYLIWVFRGAKEK